MIYRCSACGKEFESGSKKMWLMQWCETHNKWSRSYPLRGVYAKSK